MTGYLLLLQKAEAYRCQEPHSTLRNAQSEQHLAAGNTRRWGLSKLHRARLSNTRSRPQEQGPWTVSRKTVPLGWHQGRALLHRLLQLPASMEPSQGAARFVS